MNNRPPRQRHALLRRNLPALGLFAAGVFTLFAVNVWATTHSERAIEASDLAPDLNESAAVFVASASTPAVQPTIAEKLAAKKNRALKQRAFKKRQARKAKRKRKGGIGWPKLAGGY